MPKVDRGILNKQDKHILIKDDISFRPSPGIETGPHSRKSKLHCKNDRWCRKWDTLYTADD